MYINENIDPDGVTFKYKQSCNSMSYGSFFYNCGKYMGNTAISGSLHLTQINFTPQGLLPQEGFVKGFEGVIEKNIHNMILKHCQA